MLTVRSRWIADAAVAKGKALGAILAEVREKLGPPGAVERAADMIAGMLNQS